MTTGPAPPTIGDVARRAGVSRTTASRVLNESPHVDEGTRRRVLDAIAALDFTPSQAARRLGAGRPGSLARAERTVVARVGEVLRLGRGAGPPGRASALAMVEQLIREAPAAAGGW